MNTTVADAARAAVRFPGNLVTVPVLVLAVVLVSVPGAAEPVVLAWEWIKWNAMSIIDTLVWWLGLPGIEHDPSVLVHE